MKLFEIWKRSLSIHICDVLHDLVPFVQFRKRKKHPWRSVTFSKVAFNEQDMFYCHFDKTQARKKNQGTKEKELLWNCIAHRDWILYCSPALAEACCEFGYEFDYVGEFGYVRLSVCPSVLFQSKTSELSIIFFYLKLDMSKTKWWILIFGKRRKKIRWIRRVQRVPKMSQELRFWGFDKNLINSHVLFFTSLWKY